MSDIPIQADNIQLRPGEQAMPMNYEITRYQPFCGNEECVVDVHFDQLPPLGTKCKHRHGYYLDKDYEAAKRITADNPTGAPRPLSNPSASNKPIVDFTQLPSFQEVTKEKQLQLPPPEEPLVIELDPMEDIFGP